MKLSAVKGGGQVEGLPAAVDVTLLIEGVEHDGFDVGGNVVLNGQTKMLHIDGLLGGGLPNFEMQVGASRAAGVAGVGNDLAAAYGELTGGKTFVNGKGLFLVLKILNYFFNVF